MYKIKNGLMYEDEKKRFALGQSYYPSFHPSKFPVMPDGDRIGEMKKDLRGMKEMGFNHVRFAALGNVTLENGEIKIDTPFIDAMIEEAGRIGLSVSIRLQGFTVNLRGFDDADMISWNGEKYGVEQPKRWCDFVRTTLYHEGINEDNDLYAKSLAEHYKKYENVVGFQIYNEPHYPGGIVYDYHPKTLKAYRKWAAERGVITKDEAKDYEPPRSRHEKSPEEWAYWCLFSMESLTQFLNRASDASKAGAPEHATFTCFTSDAIDRINAARGVDYFGNTKAMDILGYTCYIRGVGADFYPMCLQVDTAMGAAKLGGRECWCIELDSRTYIPHYIFNRNTYATLGTGVKGIVYYQWRGDCPVPGVPYPNSCGLLNYDGTKTNNFDNAARVVSFINEMSDAFMEAERAHDGVGLLHSDFASFLTDANENTDKQVYDDDVRNSYVTEYTQTYRDLREAGYSVDITNAEHLDETPFGIRVLFVPRYKYLSKEEKAAVNRFMQNGGTVYHLVGTAHVTNGFGFKKLGTTYARYEDSVYDISLLAPEACEKCGILPKVRCDERTVGTQILEGDGYKLIVLTNTSSARETNSCRLKLAFDISEAEIRTFDNKGTLTFSENEICVRDFTDGAVIIVK